MTSTSVSPCGRFVVLNGLHIDRNVYEGLMRWAADRELRIQDAIQLAVCCLRSVTMDPARVSTAMATLIPRCQP